MVRIATFRALSYVFANRIVQFAGWVFLFGAAVLLAGIIALAYYFTDWWLLLLLLYIPSLVIGTGMYIFARVILRALYPHKLTSAQKRSAAAFNDKVLHLLEARAIPPWALVGIIIKDLIVHRELTTLQQLFDDSKSLKNDFSELENELSKNQNN